MNSQNNSYLIQINPNQYDNNNNNSAGNLLLNSVPIALLIFLGIGAIWFINSFLCICKPNEVVILSGMKRKSKDRQDAGYRVISGGRAIRIPILETVKRMDVTTTPIRIEIKNAYSKGNIPLNIVAIANVKVSSKPEIVGNAIERFLDRDRAEIIRVAKETLEGNLRGVVATMTPEQVNEDRLKFAESITSNVSQDLFKLGLEIDTLKIQNVADEVDYLNSLGRERIALVMRDAEIAESNALNEAEQIVAECEEQATVAKTRDQIIILEQENELRKLKAKLEQQAKSEEEITIAAAKEKRAIVEEKFQQVRAELERLRLQADEVLPAEAQQEAETFRARGQAAIFEENAKAEALVNELFAEVWQNTGSEASAIFLIQQLETILEEAIKIPKRLHLERVNIVDNGDGKSLATLIKVYPEIVNQFLASVHQTLGIDVVGTLTNKIEK
ncbi:MAG: flotillin family protein [Microcystis sp.]|jgi:flotillin|nr:flotillin family protein [Microcystis aeruginosa LE13-04]NCS40352.1 flotillin family protein [Microcystis aeruginosa BS13-10]